MNVGLLQPIPWTFTDAPGVLQWTWVTEHFVAKVTGTEVAEDDGTGRRVVRSYGWDLADRIRPQQGMPRHLVDGISSSFDEAESRVREHLGKSYDSRLGYRRFAGSLAFTFTLSSGEVVDVSPFIGTRCAVTVLLPDRSERTVSGDFDVHHYKWQLSSPGEVVTVIPEHVLRITNRSLAAEKAAAITHIDSYSGVGRIYREEPRPGCTGRPGYTVGTVDHAGAHRCPLHESGLPEHLLR